MTSFVALLESPHTYYSTRLDEQRQRLDQQKRMSLVSSVLRGILFVLTLSLIYFLRDDSSYAGLTGVIGLASFLYLVKRHATLRYEISKTKELIAINEAEMRALSLNLTGFDEGNDLSPDHHAFAHDVDLFGRGSFFQLVNRSTLSTGRIRLGQLLCANDEHDIPQKQEGLRELAGMPDWRQEFRATARLVETDDDDKVILKWIGNYVAFVPKIMSALPIVFSLISLFAISAYVMDYLGGVQLLTWFVIGLLITAIYLSKIDLLASKSSKAHRTFNAYGSLVAMIEEADIQSPYLIELRSALVSNSARTSAKVSQFAKVMAALDQRYNLLFGVLANGFLLWDLRQSYRIEKWMAVHGAEVAEWFDCIASFDAHIGLGTYIFNHPDSVFPHIAPESPYVLDAKDANHPLLNPEKAVGNQIRVGQGEFHIITGANMAGKSTYLRTVSLQIIMANLGLPVCASSCVYAPVKLITSMRSTDSLDEDTSYFFSELKRLRYIMDQLVVNRYFVILDEILKGTNSTDKAIGSRKFVKRLVESGSTGIIATHDLSLCELGDELEEVENYFLDAEIVNDELSFDYTLKKGICQNMNASFLLEKMGLV